MKTYKTDEAIAAEFSGFTLESIEHNENTGAQYRSGYITITWPNADESVGGGIEKGDTTTDRYIDYNGDGSKIAFDSWYPTEVSNKLIEAIIASYNQ